MNHIKSLHILGLALKKTIEKGRQDWDPLISTKIQLEYCLDALSKKNDRSRLKDIMFYQYAIHEFEGIDANYADLLHKAAKIVDLMLEKKL